MFYAWTFTKQEMNLREFHHLVREHQFHPETFQQYFRMSEEQFD